MLNKAGKVVSKRQHAAGKALQARGRKEGWLAKPFARGGAGGGAKRTARQKFTNVVDDARHNGQPYTPGTTLDHMQAHTHGHAGSKRKPPGYTPTATTAAAFAI